MIGIIVLAAGKGERFGGDKMLATIEHQTFLEHTLDKLQGQHNNPIVCVTSTKVYQKIHEYQGILWRINNHPELGISYSIKQGIEVFRQQKSLILEGYLFIVGDQPLLKTESIQGLIEAFNRQPHKIHCVVGDTKKGNPVIFPIALEEELLTLQGDTGGKVLLKRYPEDVLYYQVEKEELWDLDTQEAYEEFKRRI